MFLLFGPFAAIAPDTDLSYIQIQIISSDFNDDPVPWKKRSSRLITGVRGENGTNGRCLLEPDVDRWFFVMTRTLMPSAAPPYSTITELKGRGGSGRDGLPVTWGDRGLASMARWYFSACAPRECTALLLLENFWRILRGGSHLLVSPFSVAVWCGGDMKVYG